MVYVSFMIYLQQPAFKGDQRNNKPFFHFFNVFYLGSMIAFIFKRCEDFNIPKKIKNFALIDKILCALCFIVFIFGIRMPYSYGETDFFRHGNFWSIFISLMLLSAPNAFTRWLESLYILRKFGHYSFGAYLFHLFALNIVSTYQFFGIYNLTNGIDKLLMAFVLAYLFGMVFHHAIEKWMIKTTKYLVKSLSKHFIVENKDQHENCTTDQMKLTNKFDFA